MLSIERPSGISDIDWVARLLDSRKPEDVQLAGALLATMVSPGGEGAGLDPVAIWGQMEFEIGKMPPGHSHEWIQKRNKWIETFNREIDFMDRGEVWGRLLEVDRARWAMDEIQSHNQAIFDGFELSELWNVREMTEVIAQANRSRMQMADLKRSGLISELFEQTDMVDVIQMATGVAALAAEKGFSVGRRVVDLGAGDGMAAIAMARSGFEVVAVEKDWLLVRKALANLKELQQKGVQLDPQMIRFIQREFKVTPEENDEDIRNVLQTADGMYCYPWSNEVKPRLQLFANHAKKGAWMVMCEPVMDIASGVRVNFIDKNEVQFANERGIEVVTATDKYGYPAEIGRMPTIGFGFAWWMFRKI